MPPLEYITPIKFRNPSQKKRKGNYLVNDGGKVKTHGFIFGN